MNELNLVGAEAFSLWIKEQTGYYVELPKTKLEEAAKNDLLAIYQSIKVI